MNLSIDRTYLHQTLRRLVQINSVNPDLVPGSPGEAEVSRFVAKQLSALGLEVRLHEPRPGRISVVGILPGRGGGPSLMLNAHYDTVGVEGMPDPFSASIREGRLYGRGSYDMKASLAACLAAIKALQDAKHRLRGDLMVAAVADEEYASLGTSDLLQHYSVDGAVVTEPTELEICLAHKGFIWLEVESQGRAYHGSQFSQGIDAIMRMGRFLASLEGLEKELRARPPHPLLGPPSLHASMIEGGTSLSVYSASCRLKIERRTVPGETEDQVRGEIETLLEPLRQADPTFKASLRTILVREPFEVHREAAIVRSVESACRRVLDATPRYCGQNPWMDSALFASAGIETVVLGPVGGGAHSDQEWVDLESVERLAEVLAITAIDYTGSPRKSAKVSRN